MHTLRHSKFVPSYISKTCFLFYILVFILPVIVGSSILKQHKDKNLILKSYTSIKVRSPDPIKEAGCKRPTILLFLKKGEL